MAGMKTLGDLFEDELRDIYDAEKQIVKALPKMIKSSTSEKLGSALETHLEETRGTGGAVGAGLRSARFCGRAESTATAWRASSKKVSR